MHLCVCVNVIKPPESDPGGFFFGCRKDQPKQQRTEKEMVSKPIEYLTQGGINVKRSSFSAVYETAISEMVDRVNQRRGAVLSSNYEYPGRYTRWDTAIVDPPLGIESNGRAIRIFAYNERGKVLLPAIKMCWPNMSMWLISPRGRMDLISS